MVQLQRRAAAEGRDALHVPQHLAFRAQLLHLRGGSARGKNRNEKRQQPIAII